MKRLRLLAVIGVLAVLAVVGAIAVPAFGATKSVGLKDNRFVPKRLTVRHGTTLHFVWRGKLPHNVVVKRGPAKFRSPVKIHGTFNRKVTRRGTYKLVCEVHFGMTMTLKVT
jgi:plastocyanin